MVTSIKKGLIGKNVFQLLFKCIQQNLFWKHQCQRETPKEVKILWIVLCSKLTLFEQRSNQFGIHGSLHLLNVIKSFIQGEFVCLEVHSVLKILVLIRF